MKATPAKISRCLSKLPHGVSTIISKLEQEGLIQNVDDLSRKNMVRVVLTERGKETQQKAKQREAIHNIGGNAARYSRPWLCSLT